MTAGDVEKAVPLEAKFLHPLILDGQFQRGQVNHNLRGIHAQSPGLQGLDVIGSHRCVAKFVIRLGVDQVHLRRPQDERIEVPVQFVGRLVGAIKLHTDVIIVHRLAGLTAVRGVAEQRKTNVTLIGEEFLQLGGRPCGRTLVIVKVADEIRLIVPIEPENGLPSPRRHVHEHIPVFLARCQRELLHHFGGQGGGPGIFIHIEIDAGQKSLAGGRRGKIFIERIVRRECRESLFQIGYDLGIYLPHRASPHLVGHDRNAGHHRDTEVRRIRCVRVVLGIGEADVQVRQGAQEIGLGQDVVDHGCAVRVLFPQVRSVGDDVVNVLDD